MPSALAELLARAITQQLFGKSAPAGSLKLIPPKRLDIPEPESPIELPEKYRALIGQHDDHPGTGKGRRAIAREAALTLR